MLTAGTLHVLVQYCLVRSGSFEVTDIQVMCARMKMLTEPNLGLLTPLQESAAFSDLLQQTARINRQSTRHQERGAWAESSAQTQQ